MNKKLRGVYLITDTTVQQRYDHEQLAEMAIQGGVNIVQFRNKTGSANETFLHARNVAEACTAYDTLNIINDRTDIAMAAEASGVHLGQDDLPITAARKLMGKEKIIGGTSSTLEEAKQIEAEGGDYVALGHIFETSTKEKEYPPLGLKYLHKVSKAVTIPLVAIGGITLKNASEVIAAGADMIAVSSAICCAEDPVEATKQLVNSFKKLV